MATGPSRQPARIRPSSDNVGRPQTNGKHSVRLRNPRFRHQRIGSSNLRFCVSATNSRKSWFLGSHENSATGERSSRMSNAEYSFLTLCRGHLHNWKIGRLSRYQFRAGNDQSADLKAAGHRFKSDRRLHSFLKLTEQSSTAHCTTAVHRKHSPATLL